jgi:chemotaxis protein methyltransferase WspC
MAPSSVEEWLRGRIGLDPAAAGRGLIGRAVRARMIALGLGPGETEHFRSILDRSEGEAEALVDEVVVSESWFFRDALPFAALAERATARFNASAGTGQPLFRVLSVPCAGGEEPYSVAIALLDAGLPPGAFQVVAADISRRSLDLARRAVYTGNAFRSADLGFRDRHFRPVGDGYALDPPVVRLVRFHQANLLAPDVLAGEPPFDAIFCRNLLIYLDEPARERVLANLDRLLAPGGVVFVGHAERLGMLGDRFRATGPKGSFAFERVPDRTEVQALNAGPERLPKGPSHPPHREKPRPRPSAWLGRSLRRPGVSASPDRGVEDSAPATRMPPPEARPVPAPPTAPDPTPLATASRLADEGRHAEAARLCEAEIKARGPSAPAYFLLGMVRQAAGDHAQAEACFVKAVYLDGAHEDALLALALLAQRRGDRAAADSYRKRAERAFRENARS